MVFHSGPGLSGHDSTRRDPAHRRLASHRQTGRWSAPTARLLRDTAKPDGSARDLLSPQRIYNRGLGMRSLGRPSLAWLLKGYFAEPNGSRQHQTSYN